MQLEVNHNHKKIDFNKMGDPFKRFCIGALGTVFGINLYGGALINTVYASNSNDSEPVTYTETIVDDLPEDVRSDVLWRLKKNHDAVIYEHELVEIERLVISAYDDTDLSFLQKFPNLHTISIQCRTDDMSFLDSLKSFNGLKDVGIYYCGSLGTLNKDNLDFLNSINLDCLSIVGFYLYPGCEDSLKNVDELSFGCCNFDIDFSKLTSLKKINLSRVEPYDLAVCLPSDAYQKLIDAGVEIEFYNDAKKELFLNANSKLDEIVKSLDINDNSTDQEKLDAVLIYVLENLEYDEGISKMIREVGVENVVGAGAFYEDGRLFGALEKDSAICGNYSALVEALLNRVGMSDKSAYVRNDYHAWNVVNVDGETYLVDATWLDGQTVNVGRQVEEKDETGITIRIEFDSYDAIELLKSGDPHQLRWYMEEMDDEHIASIDTNGLHSNAFIPEYMFVDEETEALVEVSDDLVEEKDEFEELPDIGKEKIKVKIGGKEMIIGAGALVGVLSALGGAICVHNKKERERRRRLAGSYNYSSDYTFNGYFDDDFSNYRRR